METPLEMVQRLSAEKSKEEDELIPLTKKQIYKLKLLKKQKPKHPNYKKMRAYNLSHFELCWQILNNSLSIGKSIDEIISAYQELRDLLNLLYDLKIDITNFDFIQFGKEVVEKDIKDWKEFYKKKE